MRNPLQHGHEIIKKHMGSLEMGDSPLGWLPFFQASAQRLKQAQSSLVVQPLCVSECSVIKLRTLPSRSVCGITGAYRICFSD